MTRSAASRPWRRPSTASTSTCWPTASCVPYFASTDFTRQKRHLRAFLTAALGGPDLYKGRDMGAAHRGMGITSEAFDHVVGHLVTTLTELGVGPATIATIGGALAPLRAQIVEEPLSAAA